MYKAVFLDRDGVLNHDAGYVSDNIPLVLNNVPAALKLLKDAFFKLIVVSNQSGVSTGRFSLDQVLRFQDRLQLLISRQGGPIIDSWFYCTHDPAQACACRKPKPGLLLEAALAHQIDLSRSYMIGDKESDALAGQAAGVRRAYTIPSNGEDLFKAAHHILVGETDDL